MRTTTMRRPVRHVPSLVAAALLTWAAPAISAAAQAAPAGLRALPAWETAHPFAAVPHPREVFGFEPGADYRLATNAQILAYFDRLDAASDRVEVVRIGETVLGREMIVAFISSEANIAQLDRWRDTAARLARGRIPEAEARTLAADGKAIVWIDGGLHATEVAGAQHAPLLAYRVAAEESEEMRRIRDDVILMLMPVMTPDGLDLVADWTARSADTEWAGSSPPVLYQHYTGHDNNRDWFMITQPETRAVTDVIYNQWYPQIVYNQHQTAPWPARIFIPPFADPVNPNIQPLVVRGVNAVGAAMGQRFAEEDKPGAISRITFDMWWNGGMRTTPYYHNMVGILTETAHASVAPRCAGREALPAYIGNFPALEPSVFYPDPWLGGCFHLRDAVEYMITGAVAVLDIGSELREEWLFNIWRMGAHAVAAGEAGGPFAYIVPPTQRNPREAVEMVNVLRRGGVEVHRAGRSFRAGGENWPAGSYVMFAGQAFRSHLMDLMERQVYPDMRLYPDGPPDPPYDVSGWTLPIQMDVRAVRVDEPFTASGLASVDEAAVWPGAVSGNARWGWELDGESNAAAIAINRLLESGATVALVPGEAEAGSVVVRRDGDTEGLVTRLARDLGVSFTGLRSAPPAGMRALELPRIGLYKSWQANMDEGWTRWVLEQYDFPVDTLHDAEIRTGDLSRYHAIILPDQGATSIMHGYAEGTRPAEMTGGIGLEGMLRLQRYVEDGGRILAFDGATELLIDHLALPLRNAVDGLPSERFFIPGTLVRIDVDTSHPFARGMPDQAAASFVRSAAFDVGGGSATDAEVLARYGETDLLLSGWALGEDRYLAGRAAVVRVPVGRGDVVLFGFRPQFRAQPRGTFKLIFNALHEAAARDLPASGAATPER
ncbi:MAG TPA: M14 family metallopeptidase [Longimicrobiales bacterium]|nr:M14 family metallopeptidase [Longimicrobiales bacterium]